MNILEPDLKIKYAFLALWKEQGVDNFPSIPLSKYRDSLYVQMTFCG
jgi:hypothetical protein